MASPAAPANSAGVAAEQAGGWQTARFLLPLRPAQPLIMGVLNVTPDSFSDGGQFTQLDSALRHARQLLDQGADILDIGAESTRPGAAAVSADDEWQRLAPVLDELKRWQVPLSLDSMKPEVMRKGLAAGVDILNDVSGFTDPLACELLRDSDAAAVIMHMQGQPRTMQQAPRYADVVPEVLSFLQQRVAALSSVGVAASRLLVDPGFGFGKTLDHNLALFKAIPQFAAMGAGVLVGVSRKSMIGQILNQPDPLLRIHGSVAAALAAASLGAQVLRVHDVQATCDALRVWQALGVA